MRSLLNIVLCYISHHPRFLGRPHLGAPATPMQSTVRRRERAKLPPAGLSGAASTQKPANGGRLMSCDSGQHEANAALLDLRLPIHSSTQETL